MRQMILAVLAILAILALAATVMRQTATYGRIPDKKKAART